LQCKIIGLDTGETLGAAAGTALLNESERAMLGDSYILQPADPTPPVSTTVAATPVSITDSDTAVRIADERSREPHPLNPDVKRRGPFPFPIKVMIGGKERPLKFQMNDRGGIPQQDCFLPVKVGEVYEIRIGNRSKKTVTMRLLIDGLNTLPEPETDAKGLQTLVWGKRVNMDEARARVLDPRDAPYTEKGIPFWKVSGFATQVGSQGKVREFTVVDASQALAARGRGNFTDQIGMITAAFYTAEKNDRRSVGTAAGRERRVPIGIQSGVKVGTPLATVTIRYGDTELPQPRPGGSPQSAPRDNGRSSTAN
jgi:hypothetical protein